MDFSKVMALKLSHDRPKDDERVRRGGVAILKQQHNRIRSVKVLCFFELGLVHYCHFTFIRYNTLGINSGASVFVPKFVPNPTYFSYKFHNLLN